MFSTGKVLREPRNPRSFTLTVEWDNSRKWASYTKAQEAVTSLTVHIEWRVVHQSNVAICATEIGTFAFHMQKEIIELNPQQATTNVSKIYFISALTRILNDVPSYYLCCSDGFRLMQCSLDQLFPSGLRP